MFKKITRSGTNQAPQPPQPPQTSSYDSSSRRKNETIRALKGLKKDAGVYLDNLILHEQRADILLNIIQEDKLLTNSKLSKIRDVIGMEAVDWETVARDARKGANDARSEGEVGLGQAWAQRAQLAAHYLAEVKEEEAEKAEAAEAAEEAVEAAKAAEATERAAGNDQVGGKRKSKRVRKSNRTTRGKKQRKKTTKKRNNKKISNKKISNKKRTNKK